MAINDITLGDDQPLSNDLKPIKVGGEASILNVSSPTPDGSVDGEVEIKGKLKAKDTIIQGNIKAFTDDDTTAQFVFESTQGANNRFDVKAAANTRSAIRIFNNQGYFELRRNSNTTSLQFTDGTNTPLTLDGNTATFAGNVTVDTDTLHVDSTNNRVGIGTTSPIAPLHIESTINALADTDEPENCHLLLRNAANDTNEGVGIGFLISAQTDDIGSSIVYKRTGSNAKGELRFNVKTNTTDDGVITQAMTIDDSANVGIGTTSPDSPLHIQYDNSSGEGAVHSNFNNVGLQIENTNASGVAAIQLRSSDSDGYILYDDDGPNEGNFHFKTDGQDGASVLTLQDGGNVGIGTESPTTTLDVEGTVSYKHTSLTADSDDLDVSGVTVVECTPSGTDRLGGLTGGVQGQILYILKVDSGLGRVIIEHNEGTGNQDIFLSGASDVMLSSRGGITLYCNGTSWFALDK